MRLSLRAALFAAILVTGACFAYRPVAPAPTPGGEERIVLRTAVAVATVVDGGDGARRSYPDVMEVRGTVRGVGDTLAIRLGELRTAAGPVPGVSGRIALLPATSIAEIRERRVQVGRTLLAVGGVALLIAAFVTAMQVSVMTSYH